MQYLKVKWLHKFLYEPIEMYSELDADRREVRKVEVFPNSSMTYVSCDQRTGTSKLSETPLPTVPEIAADDQFLPVEISAIEFQFIWALATKMGA